MNEIEFADLDEARDLKHTLEKMVESQGWLFFERFLQSRVEGRNKELIALCPSDVPEMVRYARIKGGAEEAELIPQMLKAVISDLEDQIRHLADQEEEDDA